MSLLVKFMSEIVERVDTEQFRVRIFGDLAPLSGELKAITAKAVEKSEKYDRFNLNICLNYGGKCEIVNAVKEIVSEGLKASEIDENAISSRLYSKEVPDPDLIIRPGGEVRISNFLLWQSAYSELYFTDVLWPDFKESDLRRAIAEFGRRNRRFGGR
jgi:undecaprenyl diphosphate synthase